ncbi:MAG: hypothetical protein EOO45_18080, partial [Flavobacterium sp.]
MNKMIPCLLPVNLLWLKRKLFLIFLLMISVSAFAQKELFSTIEKRISADLQTGINDVFLAKRITKDLTKLKADGSWTDINYADAQYDPLKRIKEMATAYIRPANKFYGNQEIYGAITTSLQNWLDRNPKNKNWWYNDIFYPQAIGQTLILMRNGKTQLPVELEKVLIQRMVRKLKVGDGANTSDEALHYLYRACLTQNKNTLDSAAKYLFEPIAVEDGKEGVQVDGSYYQHGKQQAIASYGRVFAGNSVNAAYYLRDTEYALPKAQLHILVSYLKDTFLTKAYVCHSLFCAVMQNKYGIPGGEAIGATSGHLYTDLKGTLSALEKLMGAHEIQDLDGDYKEYVEACLSTTHRVKQRTTRSQWL